MLGGRLTVSLRPLEPRIGVRIPASQPQFSFMMRFGTLLLSITPLFLYAQEPKPASRPAATPPGATDQALRERETTFLQYQVDGAFRKAYDLVAEDSKDFYFAIEKTK